MEISSQGCGGIQLARSLGPGNFILGEEFLQREGRESGRRNQFLILIYRSEFRPGHPSAAAWWGAS